MAFDEFLVELADGPERHFGEWPPIDLPTGPSGVYTVWNGPQFLYVGMAYAHRDETNTKASGVVGRLKSHASGRRSGDQFCIYICDRFVVPTLTKEELEALASGERFLDRRTRDFIHQNLTYRTVLTASGSQARELELYVRQSGLPGVGRPAINP